MRLLNWKIFKNHLKQQGYNCTPQRLEMLTFFVKQRNRFVTARSILEYLREKMGNVSVDTVYRNLHLFKEIGFIDASSYCGKSVFHLKNTLHRHEHRFICTECGGTTKLAFCPMENIDATLHGYVIYDHKFEIYGRCPTCSTSS
ncbi:Fur family transcriptional regulator [Alteribacillus sp. HJP-4]|uniref:Fur family transcriptional regulator n=1 Tax=Alteribacillus sp. HJP-4 TaxID=2775394 RepID=UPI0035CD1B02